MFVDDGAQAELREMILPSIHASEHSAYTLLGHPDGDRRTSCLSAEKWRDTAHYTMEFLGFEVNTRTMMIRWPIAKRLALKVLIKELWLGFPCRRLPRKVAQLLGIIRNAAYVAPLGSHLSIRLQQCLNAAIGHAGHRVTKLTMVVLGESTSPQRSSQTLLLSTTLSTTTPSTLSGNLTSVSLLTGRPPHASFRMPPTRVSAAGVRNSTSCGA